MQNLDVTFFLLLGALYLFLSLFGGSVLKFLCNLKKTSNKWETVYIYQGNTQRTVTNSINTAPPSGWNCLTDALFFVLSLSCQSVIVSMLSTTYLCYLACSSSKCVMFNIVECWDSQVIRKRCCDFPGSLPNTVCQDLMVQEQESAACKVLHMLWIKCFE